MKNIIKKYTCFFHIVLLPIIIFFLTLQSNSTFLFGFEKTLYNTQNNQPCEHVKPIGPMGIRKFTTGEQKWLGFTSNQYLCYVKGACQPKTRQAIAQEGRPPDPEPPERLEIPIPEPPPNTNTEFELPNGPPADPGPPLPDDAPPLIATSERQQQYSRPTVKVIICDVTSCSNSDRECQCPTDPMECLKDTIDGRSSYTNGQKMVKIDDEASGCQSTSPIKAKELTIEEKRQYGFKIDYICYSEEVKNCRINGVQIKENTTATCDVAIIHGRSYYSDSPCQKDYVGVSCACPVGINECVEDKIDGQSMYSNTTNISVEQEVQRSRAQPQRNGRGGGIQ